MRVAVLSDIHGNWFALSSVLDDAVRESVTEVWCLGDVVGYGPLGLECYEELKALGARWNISMGVWLAGNHDLALVGKIPLKGFQPDAQWVLRQAELLASRDAEMQRRFRRMCEFLSGCPTFAESSQAGVWLMHGWVTRNQHGEVDEQGNVTGRHSYIRYERDDSWKAERSWEVLSSLAADEIHCPDIILAGHTHQPLLWRRFAGNDWRADPPPEKGLRPPARWLGGCPKCGPDGPCRSGKRWEQSLVLPITPVLINPGSVGQPRDGCPAAAYAILDFEEHRTRVTFKRVGYDVWATKDSLAGLGKKADGSPDPEAMRSHVESLRTALMRGG